MGEKTRRRKEEIGPRKAVIVARKAKKLDFVRTEEGKRKGVGRREALLRLQRIRGRKKIRKKKKN